MYRDELPPASLVPVARALESVSGNHGWRSNDSDFGALGGLADPSFSVVEHVCLSE